MWSATLGQQPVSRWTSPASAIRSRASPAAPGHGETGQRARQGLVARVRGGVRALQQGQSEVGFELRLRLEVERKRAIAAAAAAMIGEGESVAIDASTTGYYLALELRSKRELVVVTNGLLVATALADAPGI